VKSRSLGTAFFCSHTEHDLAAVQAVESEELGSFGPGGLVQEQQSHLVLLIAHAGSALQVGARGSLRHEELELAVAGKAVVLAD
jgi:hypothetical protein